MKGKSSIGHKIRAPKCSRCRNHGMESPLKGHKANCLWKDCICSKCLISSDKQKATAQRIALFRQLTKENRKNELCQEIYRVRELGCSTLKNNDIHGLNTSETAEHDSNSERDLLKTDKSYKIRPSQQVHEEHTATKDHRDVKILERIFPFYDEDILFHILKRNKSCLLDTVLEISQNITAKEYTTLPPSQFSFERCCNSTFCPVNSYMALKTKYQNPNIAAIEKHEHEASRHFAPVEKSDSLRLCHWVYKHGATENYVYYDS